MRDDFNFEQTLGLVAQAFQNKKYEAAFAPLKELALHSEQKDIVPVMESAFDTLVSAIDPLKSLDCIEVILEGLNSPKNDAENTLQEHLVRKWKEILDNEIATPQYLGNALQYLTWVNRDIDIKHPLQVLALSAWEALVESDAVSDFMKQRALNFNDEIKTPEFRLALLKKIAAHQHGNPDETLDALNKVISGFIFANFRQTDRASANLLVKIMADILKDRANQYTPEKTLYIARNILVSGKDFNAADVKTIAGIYLDAAKKLETEKPEGTFDVYRELAGMGNKQLSVETVKANESILDMAETGKLRGVHSSFPKRNVAGYIFEYLYHLIIQGSSNTWTLVDRAMDILYPQICEDLRKGDGWDRGDYQHAIWMLNLLHIEHPGRPQLVTLIKEGLKQHFEEDPRDHVQKINMLLNSAVTRNDVTLQQYAEAEWKAGIEAVAAKSPLQAYETVERINNYADETPALRVLVDAVLPELAKRAGIESKPKAIDSGEFLKRFGSGKKDKKAPAGP